jgi:glycosyltransferase involved in cell wall biosynthesis
MGKVINILMPLPKVSIIIPTYNQSKYIEECISSALTQDYNNLEVIVSDDASTDNTSQIINRFNGDSRLRYFKNTNNLGRVGNYRKALYEYASGEWAVVLDGDDYYTDPFFISEAVEWTQKDSKIVLVGAGQEIIKGSQKKIYSLTEEDKIVDGFDLFLQWSNKGTPHLASVYNRRLAMDIDFYRVNIISSDRESMLRLILNGKVAVLSRIVGVWRKHEANESNNLDYNEFTEDFNCIEMPYKYAMQKGFNSHILNRWRKKMINISIVDYMNRNCNLSDLNKEKKFEIKKNIKSLFILGIIKYPFVFFRTWFLGRFVLIMLTGVNGYSVLIRYYKKLKRVS